MGLSEETKAEITAVTEEKIRQWEDTILSLDIDDLNVNIFLATMMDITDARGLVEFYAKQRIERSIVTSFGYLIQEIATIVGGDRVEKTSGNADIIHTRDGVDIYIEIKSGTASSNKKMMREMSRQHADVKEDDPDAVTALGLTYGKDEDVSSIMRGYYDGDEILVGKDFWEYLSDDPEAYVDVIEAITKARENVKNGRRGENYSLQELMERQFDTLVDDWRAEYSEEIDYRNIVQEYF